MRSIPKLPVSPDLRRHYGRWAAALSGRKFAYALAAGGALEPTEDANQHNILLRLADELRSKEPDQAFLPWKYLPPSILAGDSRRYSAERMAEQWQFLLKALRPAPGEIRQRPRLRIDSAPGYLLPSLLSTLSHAAVSAWTADVRPDELDFSWPVNLGFLDDPASNRIRGAVEGHRWNNRLFRLRDALAGESSTLLVLPNDLGRSIDKLEAIRRNIDTSALVVLGGRGRIAARDLLPAARHLQRSTSSGGIAILDLSSVGSDKTAITNMVGHMAHGLSIDSVMTEVARELRVGPPFMAFDPRVVHGLVVPTMFREFNRTLKQSALIEKGGRRGNIPFNLTDDSRVQLRIKGVPDASSVIRSLDARSADFSWKREKHAATLFADLNMAAQPLIDAASQTLPRYLQARVIAHAGDMNQSAIRKTQLVPDKDYLACVRIGHPHPDWDSLEDVFKPPQFQDGEPHRVTVVFFEPRDNSQPLVQQLEVPPLGNSLPCYFPFRTGKESGEFTAIIYVVHRNAILQAGELRAEVGGTGPTVLPMFHLVMAARLSLDHLRETRAFDGTLMFTRGANGDSYGLVSETNGNQRAVRVDDSAMNKFSEEVGKLISKIAAKPNEYGTLTSPETVKMLRQLAQHGSGLYRILQHQATATWLKTAGSRLNVGTANDAFFPLEFVYQEPAPQNKAPLCSEHRNALESGNCCRECEKAPGGVVCPMAFWGLSRFLERQCNWPEGVPAPPRGEFRLIHAAANPTTPIRPLKNAVVAASNRATVHDRDLLARLSATATRVCSKHKVSTPKDWAGWVDAVKSDQPSALILLPHHVSADGFEYLQVGADLKKGDDRDEHPGYLKSVLVTPQYVRDSGADVTPVVLLLGCDTVSARIRFESFVSVFRDAGAEIVIATVATVLGRHAGPAAEALLEEMSNAALEGKRTIGEVVLATKRKQLLAGVPMILGLTTYGGADRVLVQ